MSYQLLIDRIRDKARAWPWLFFAVITVSYVSVIAPHQVGVLLWSLSKLCIGAYLGYWIDRSLFKHGRPDHQTELQCRNTAWLRRAIIVAATIVALGLGV
ncbi:putative holin [Sulfuriflexus mobilis]|uniref:putative holin n=1 Tax=Sulfuriflexus mobilis TaxID=1811807 RepID=UPI000F82C978|nr:putative holin [Sulfuriflexus mobilis]